MTTKPNAPATVRNREAILEVIEPEFEGYETILEIGSGTGQHAIFFAQHMPWLVWQTSDLAENHDGIRAWIDEAKLANIKAPLALDVTRPAPTGIACDAVFSANTSHIMHFSAVVDMFTLVGRILGNDGKLCLYGPFNLNGEFTSDSNSEFDASLKSRDPGMGIRNLEDLDQLGTKNLLVREKLYAMPANNMLAVWVKKGNTGGEDDNNNT